MCQWLYRLAVVLSALVCNTQIQAQVDSSHPERQTLVTVVSWATPIGHTNGRDSWQANRYNYQRDREQNRNRPLEPSFALPDQQMKVGSESFLQLHQQGAIEQLRYMKQAHFDVAVYDMLPYPDYNPSEPLDSYNAPMVLYTSYLQWVKAAEKVGDIKVGLLIDAWNQSADYPKRHKLTVDEWIKCIKGSIENVPASQSVWKIDNKPVLMHFNTEMAFEPLKPGCQWEQVMMQTRATSKSFYDVADVRPHLSKASYWPTVTDAVYVFGPAGPTGYMTQGQLSYQNRSSIPYMWIVSPGYYNRGLGPDKNKDGKADGVWTQPEFTRIHETYMAAIQADARHINVLTWNDLGEDTDIWPSVNKGNCLLKIFGYYNQWFKTNKQPLCEKDTVILSYPRQIPDEVVSSNPKWGPKLKWVAPTYQHKAYYWANLTKPQQLHIQGVGKVDLPAGLSMGELGQTQAGQIKATLGGTSIMLPKIESVKTETIGCGLQYRYVDLTQIGR